MEDNHKIKACFYGTGVLGSASRVSNKSCGGCDAIGTKFSDIPVYHGNYDEGMISFYRYIYEYISSRANDESETLWIFFSIEVNATHWWDVFRSIS